MESEIRHFDPEQAFWINEGCYITEVSNSPSDENVSIAHARVESGVTTQWHKLHATAERYVIVSGHGRVEVAGLPASDVGPMDVVLIPPDTPQRITNTGSSDLCFLAICSPRFRAENYLSCAPPK